MLSIFDHTYDSDRFALVGDAAFSLLRQWFLRTELQTPENPAIERAAGAPTFFILEDPRLTPDRWIGGIALALLSFAGVSFMIGHGGNASTRSIGSRMSSESGVRVQSGALGANPDTEVKVSFEAAARDRVLIAGYFHSIAVLDALDADHDLVISADEIANAPIVLQSLDRNHDGALDASECRPDVSRFSKQAKLAKRLPPGKDL
jgi:hypothetical protein